MLLTLRMRDFTAGPGHTVLEKTELVDRQGAMKGVNEAENNHVKRFIMSVR
ncbi:hypothetical protein [Lentibacillus sp. CBA3610]|uniref:hypothetical protein n=1 Tax=Lentibacillus sp. CBA3610 TaxID=2518176 RepID=UPI0015954596|nr:hypothetical protein [Lentibacillus sp. CBA3610]